MFRSPHHGLVATMLLVTSCLGGQAVGCNLFPPNGLAGNGSFQYDCSGKGDPECDDRQAFELEAQLPSRPIARGARFRLSYLNGRQSVQSVSSAVVTGSGDSFTVQRGAPQRPGSIGFFVLAEEPDQIEEAIRLRVADADRVVIDRLDPAVFGEPGLSVDDASSFRAVGFSKNDPLAGSLPISWEIDDVDVADLEATSLGTCRVRPRKRGKVVLIARFGDLEDRLALTIGGTDSSKDAGSNDAETTEAGDAAQD